MIAPTDVQRQLAQARTLIAAGKWDEAARINARLLASDPKHPGVQVQASRLAQNDGSYRRSRAHALEAWRCRRLEPPILNLILQRLHEFVLADEMHVMLDEMVAAGILQPGLIYEAARTLNGMNEPERAHALLDLGLAASPGNNDLLVTRAQTRMFLGDFDGAEDDIARVLAVQPHRSFPWWVRAQLRRQTPQSNHVDALLKLLQDPRLSANDIVFVAYALHKELDDLGDIPGAVAALDLACRTRRSQLPYDVAETRRMFAALEASATVPSAPMPAGGRTPVFIVGMHRSGTTLLEHEFGARADVRPLGELYDLNAALGYATDYFCPTMMDPELATRTSGIDAAALGADYLASVDWRLGAEPVFTDKLPSNFLNIGVICRALPQARIVHMVRDPMETGLSNLREYFADSTNRYSYDQAEFADFYLGYERLMAHWHRAFPGRILDVRYDDLTTDPAGTLAGVAAFCGLAPDAGAGAGASTRAVTTASAVQVRGGVRKLAQPKWLRYAEYLAPMQRALGR